MKASYLDITKIKNPNQCLSWWLVHSFLYYRYGTSLISDEDWNLLGRWLAQSWSQVTHPHAHFVDISAGHIGSTAFYISTYPKVIESTAMMLLRWDAECKKRNKLALRRWV